MTVKDRIELSFRKKGFSVTWQKLRFGFERAVIECKSEVEFSLAYEIGKRIRNTKQESWIYRQGEFEGYIYLMDRTDSEQLHMMMRQEQESVENWWQRYHAADPLTKRKMACGEIA